MYSSGMIRKHLLVGSEPLIRVVTSRELCHCVPDLIMLSSLFLNVSAAMCCNVQILPADQNATS